MYKTPKEIFKETYGIVDKIPKVCELCHAKLERKSLYSDVIMHRKFNPKTGKRDGKTFFVDGITNKYKDKLNYMLWCTKCSLCLEVIISYKTCKTKSNKTRKKIIQIL